MADKEPDPEPTVEFQENGQTTIGFGGTWKCLAGEIPTDFQSLKEPCAFHGSITPPKRKIAAARWFLCQLETCVHNEAAALMFLEAFLSEVRASTWALQNLMARLDGFDDWYRCQQAEMRQDKDLRWLVEARNNAQKQGLVFASWGPGHILLFHRSGKVETRTKEPTFEVGSERHSIEEFKRMLERVSAIINTAHERFYPDPPQRNHDFTLETIRETEDGNWEHFDLVEPPRIWMVASQSKPP